MEANEEEEEVSNANRYIIGYHRTLLSGPLKQHMNDVGKDNDTALVVHRGSTQDRPRCGDEHLETLMKSVEETAITVDLYKDYEAETGFKEKFNLEKAMDDKREMVPELSDDKEQVTDKQVQEVHLSKQEEEIFQAVITDELKELLTSASSGSIIVEMKSEFRGGAKTYRVIDSSDSDNNMEVTPSGREPLNMSTIGLDHQHNPLYRSLLRERLCDIGVVSKSDNFSEHWKLKTSKLMDKSTGSRGRYKLIDTTGDGNCFFNAISNFMYGTEILQQKLRELVIDKLMSGQVTVNLTHRPDDCSKTFCKQNVPTGHYHKGQIITTISSGKLIAYSIDEYAKIMSLDGSYATHNEVDILSDILHVNINTIVVNKDGHQLSPNACNMSIPNPTIVIMNQNEHYEPVVDTAPMIQDTKEMLCFLCKESFKNEATFRSHSLLNHAFHCPDCLLKYTNSFKREDHKSSEHNAAGNLETDTYCQMCKSQFTRARQFSRHISTEHKFSCERSYCQLRFISKNQLATHTRLFNHIGKDNNNMKKSHDKSEISDIEVGPKDKSDLTKDIENNYNETDKKSITGASLMKEDKQNDSNSQFEDLDDENNSYDYRKKKRKLSSSGSDPDYSTNDPDYLPDDHEESSVDSNENSKCPTEKIDKADKTDKDGRNSSVDSNENSKCPTEKIDKADKTDNDGRNNSIKIAKDARLEERKNQKKDLRHSDGDFKNSKSGMPKRKMEDIGLNTKLKTKTLPTPSSHKKVKPAGSFEKENKSGQDHNIHEHHSKCKNSIREEKSEDEVNHEDYNANKTCTSSARRRSNHAAHFRTQWLDNKLSPRDDNGVKINVYIRPDSYNTKHAYCSVCKHSFSLRNTGLQSVKQHAGGSKHKKLMKIISENGNLESKGIMMIEKRTPVVEAEIGLAYFMATHDISFNIAKCLEKVIKRSFPQCETAQKISLGRTKATYGTIYGNSRTEKDRLVKILNKTPFSLSIDGLNRARKKRVNYIVRYYDSNMKEITERFLTTKTMWETGGNVADGFLNDPQIKAINVTTQLKQINSDSAPILRGKKKGALARLARHAPVVAKTDPGGDMLHHVHNASKNCFKKAFPGVNELLNDTKNDITKSATKEAAYLLACKEVGCPETLLKSWKAFRWLDKYNAISDRLNQLPALKAYYDPIILPKPRKKKGHSHRQEENRIILDESSSSEDDLDSEEENEYQLPPAERRRRVVNRMKEKLCDKNYFTTDLELTVAKDNLREAFYILNKFQTKAPIIHLLQPTMLSLLRDTLLEVVEPENLKHSNGDPLDGNELKTMNIETEEERKTRRTEEKKSNGKIDQRKKSLNIRNVTIKLKDKVLLSKDIQSKIAEISETKNLRHSDKEECIVFAKEKTLKFNVEFAKSLQHYLPVDNKFLKSLVYLCPSKIDNCESEAYVAHIATTLFPNEHIEDEIRREWRKIKTSKEYFDQDVYMQYIEQCKDNSIYKTERIRLDHVWRNIIEDSITFPSLSMLLKASLSFFHATASVEGSANDVRNTVKDRSHRMLDKTLDARMTIKSAMKNSKYTCCFEYPYTSEANIKNWLSSWKCRTAKEKEDFDNFTESSTDDDRQKDKIKDITKENGQKSQIMPDKFGNNNDKKHMLQSSSNESSDELPEIERIHTKSKDHSFLKSKKSNKHKRKYMGNHESLPKKERKKVKKNIKLIKGQQDITGFFQGNKKKRESSGSDQQEHCQDL